LKEHVAIAGVIDLTGDGTDSSKEFVRELEKQNIVVDFYLDVQSLQGKGQMTVRTGYLVVGEMPSINYNLPNLDVDPNNRAKMDAATKLSEIRDEAKKWGVTIVPARRFLDLIGYRMPRSTIPPDSSIRDFSKRPAEAEADKKPEDKPEKDKPEK